MYASCTGRVLVFWAKSETFQLVSKSSQSFFGVSVQVHTVCQSKMYPSCQRLASSPGYCSQCTNSHIWKSAQLFFLLEYEYVLILHLHVTSPTSAPAPHGNYHPLVLACPFTERPRRSAGFLSTYLLSIVFPDVSIFAYWEQGPKVTPCVFASPTAFFTFPKMLSLNAPMIALKWI